MSQYIKPHTLEGWEHQCKLQTERIIELTEYAEQCLGLLRRIVAGWHQSGTAEVWAADALQEAADLVEQERKRRAALAKNPMPERAGESDGHSADAKGAVVASPPSGSPNEVLTGRFKVALERALFAEAARIAREALEETVLQMGRAFDPECDRADCQRTRRCCGDPCKPWRTST